MHYSPLTSQYSRFQLATSLGIKLYFKSIANCELLQFSISSSTTPPQLFKSLLTSLTTLALW